MYTIPQFYTRKKSTWDYGLGRILANWQLCGRIKQIKRLQALQRAMQGARTQDVTPSCRAQANQLQVAISHDIACFRVDDSPSAP